jgi:hypothetical protein
MRDVTSQFAKFREAARHLWNSSFSHPAGYARGDTAWDERDAFSRVATELFTAMVTEPLGATNARLPPMWEATPNALPSFQVQPSSSSGVPIMINRASARTGYWDDPVRQLTPDEATMHFVRFFDWDEVGQRDFKFIEASITSFPTQPQLVGRYALIEFGYATIHFIETEPV